MLTHMDAIMAKEQDTLLLGESEQPCSMQDFTAQSRLLDSCGLHPGKHFESKRSGRLAQIHGSSSPLGNR
jgi:hypothetical protein